MSSTYSQIYIQVVFAVKGRQNLVSPAWQYDLNKYISGIITAKGQKSIIVNGVTDHIHCFIGLRPSMAISELVRDIKNNSSNFINNSGWLKQKFQWQEGFGAFSYSHSAIASVYQYILKQHEHHRAETFKTEYMDLLAKFEVDYKSQYLFEWID